MDSTTAKTHLDAWLAAELACANSQSYTIGQRSLTRANLDEIRAAIARWQLAYDAAVRREQGITNPTVVYSRWS